MIPKRRTRPKMMPPKEDAPIRCQSHLKWVRGHECAVAGAAVICMGRIEAHHLQSFRAIEGGMGMKVGDDKCVPLCSGHHDSVHTLGQPAFERHYKTNLEATAADLWRTSPHGRAWRLQHEQADAPQGTTQTPQARK